jgi:tRNA U38,U39,U40 pseudouridine synthase TruA
LNSLVFDLKKFEEGCKVFEGTHCFRNYVKTKESFKDPLDYWRKIEVIDPEKSF